MGKFYYSMRDIKKIDLELYFKEFKSRENLEKIRENPVLEKSLQEIFDYCRKIDKTQPENLGFHLFKKFYIDGDREAYEKIYFENRKRLYSKVIAYLFDESSELLKSIEEEIYCLCSLYSWELPAHISIDKEEIESLGIPPQKVVGLFSAETAMFLSEIDLLLKGKLDSFLSDIIKEEIQKRVLDPYMRYTYWWENADFNWSAVCAASIGVSALINIKDRQVLDKVMEKVMDNIAVFISGFDKDGYSEEGITYWEYGVSFLLYLADWLKFYSSGKIDILRDEKIQNILRLPEAVCHPDGTGISFSDYTLREGGSLPSFIMQNLLKKAGVNLSVTQGECSAYSDHTFKFSKMIRLFKDYADEGDTSFDEVNSSYRIFQKPQVYILKNFSEEGYRCLAIEGGNNGCPHNHNDLGDFILKDGKEEIFIDLGAGAYCKDYFDDEKRYDFTVCRSAYHNTAVIDGKEQGAGKEFFTTSEFQQTDGNYLIEIDLSKAYPVEGLNYRRIFKADKSLTHIEIEDRFDRRRGFEVIFITEIKPIMQESCILILGKNSTWKLSNEKCTCSIEEFSYLDHFREETKRFRIRLSCSEEKTTTIIKRMEKWEEKNG